MMGGILGVCVIIRLLNFSDFYSSEGRSTRAEGFDVPTFKKRGMEKGYLDSRDDYRLFFPTLFFQSWASLSTKESSFFFLPSAICLLPSAFLCESRVAVSYRNSDGKAFMKRLPKGRFRSS
jgi:hypothetical protein